MIEVNGHAVVNDGHRRTRRTDAELLGSFASDADEAAFAELVCRHGPLVLGVCRRALRDRHLAEDAFQVTFMVLARKAMDLQHPEQLGNWLYGVANRVARRAGRAEGRRRDAEGRLMQIRMDDRPGTHLAVSHLQSFLDDEIHRLPAKYRAALVACHIEGKTNREAARQLGWPEGTLVTRLNRAKQMLRVRAAERGGAECAGAIGRVLARKLSPSIVPAILLAKTISAVSEHAGTGVVQTAPVAHSAHLLSKAAKFAALGKTKAVGVGLIAMAMGVSALAIAAARPREPRPSEVNATRSDSEPADLKLAMTAMTDAAPDRALLATVRADGTASFSAQEPPAITQSKPANRPPVIFGYRDNAGTAPDISDHLNRSPLAQLTRPIHIAAAPALTSTTSSHSKSPPQ
jgi:RNA polymerase sigma factor (sigma-70 family)